MSKDGEISSESCPVDSNTRAAWLESQTSTKTSSSIPLVDALRDNQSASREKRDGSNIIAHSGKVTAQRTTNLKSLWESLTAWPPPPGERSAKCEENNHNNNPNDNQSWKRGKPQTTISLRVDREISTIPRTESQLLNAGVEDENKRLVANCENESGVSPEGKWIYPSEKMFFDAMRRKGFNSDVRDMKTIVPIHNAVNEQAWKEIKQWEKPWLSEKCNGPKLHSFKGLPSSMTPKARLNTWLGYTAPFDRHDWVVDRCGKTIEYVIDFYVGRDQSSQKGSGKLNFYLDVRPKLNTFEGWKMRASKLLGLI
ncbi:putative cytochrome c1 heme lyase [Erysiphe neolycopersici]|uniref:Holocytochrome c-type synthase n=1 Tax=Erysiphe neolycopersici TaxID=212602 RepID=A0A420HSN4_9PEZI|nr:putative cytochrome c1 heme lyase [Erysiphe neolycopersici]